MKIQYVNTIALFGILFILCPAIVYSVNSEIFEHRFVEILQCISSVAGGLLFLTFFGLKQTLFRTDTVRVFTFPVIALILFIEGVSLFVANSKFFDAHWTDISLYGGGLITGAIFAVFFGVNYHLFVRIEADEVTATDEEALKEALKEKVKKKQ